MKTIVALAEAQLAKATLEHSSEVLTRVHSPSKCKGQPCSIHNRSDHALRAWPQHWRTDRYLMERKCVHGVGHPDPDHIAFVRRSMGEPAARMESQHSCDGCCKLARQAFDDRQLIAQMLKRTKRWKRGVVRGSVEQLCERFELRIKESLGSNHVMVDRYESGDDMEYGRLID